MGKNKTYFIVKWLVYFVGLLVMSFGIVLMIRADLGVYSWDVLHIGLYRQLGLTIGTWTILMGIVVLGATTLITKELPQTGAFINMLTVGVFIDLYLMIPFLETPESFIAKLIMLIVGITTSAYGMGLYISAKCGAGPRDSLMMALVEKTGRSISLIRGLIEVIVLIIGWLLGGPVFIGTIIAALSLGYVAGIMIPLCHKNTEKLLNKCTNQDGNIRELLERRL